MLCVWNEKLFITKQNICKGEKFLDVKVKLERKGKKMVPLSIHVSKKIRNPEEYKPIP